MRTNYTCIGAHIDIEGLSLVRFDLVEGKFTVLSSQILNQYPSYSECLEAIQQLSEVRSKQEIETLDLLTNFNTSLKKFILDKSDSKTVVRVRKTDINIEDMILNLMNVIGQNRIEVGSKEHAVITALQQIRETSRKKLKDIYEGNEALNQVLQAILHSVCWLEGQMIKHKMI